MKLADMSEICAVIQRDLNRVEKRTDEDFLKFNNGEVQSPDLKNNNPTHQYMVDVHLENSLAEKNLRILVDNKLNMNQQCPL